MYIQVSCEGANYGTLAIQDTSVLRMSSVSAKCMFDLKLDNVALCVVPISNKNEMEVHFNENDNGDRDEDSLVQITLHFPQGDGDDGDMTPAESLRQTIIDTGVIRSVTGNIIAEFSKEQGNFVTPRGKYALQLTSSYVHMQGSQYSYKIKYTDINALYLLTKLDGGRDVFIIALEKPIRQGNQKYQHLVLETHKIEHTMHINLTEEEISTKYDGQLSPELTMPTSHLIAKVFRVLSQTPVRN